MEFNILIRQLYSTLLGVGEGEMADIISILEKNKLQNENTFCGPIFSARLVLLPLILLYIEFDGK